MEEDKLNTKIADLPFSADLKTILQKQQLTTLRELLDRYVFEWHQMPGFDYHNQQEVVEYLLKEKLMSFVKQ